MQKKRKELILKLVILKNYIMSLAQVTEKAAIACYSSIGKGSAMSADEKAVSSMREAFQKLPMDIKIVIGEGERDKAPRLYTGEKLGEQKSSLKVDVAVDPLEGTTLCAEAREGALSVMSVSLRGELFQSPDIYMKKIASGPLAKSAIDLKASTQQNIERTAQALNKKPEDLTVGVLNRSRHKKLIEEIRESKAGIKLMGDGDVALALETALDSSSVDLLMGTGGAPEGVLAASALKCLGGGFQGQLIYQNEEEKQKAESLGLSDWDRVWDRDELVRSEVLFFATAVTTGSLLQGVKKEKESYSTQTLILSSEGLRTLNTRYF